MVEPVNMLVCQAVGNVRRLDLSLKMVTARKAHGRVSGYYRNSIKLIQLKKPRFWRGFFLKGAGQILRYAENRTTPTAIKRVH